MVHRRSSSDEPDERGQHVERIGEHRGRGFHLGGVAGIVRRPAPTDGLEVGVVREHGHVDRFGHRDVLNIPADARADTGEQLREPRVDARAEERGAAGLRRRLQRRGGVGTDAGSGEELRSRDDVDAGLEDPRDLLRVEMERRVDHAVRARAEQLVHVRSGEHAGRRIETAELGRIAADLGRIVSEDTHELEVRMGHHRRDRRTSHVAGRPLHDLPRSFWRLTQNDLSPCMALGRTQRVPSTDWRVRREPVSFESSEVVLDERDRFGVAGGHAERFLDEHDPRNARHHDQHRGGR